MRRFLPLLILPLLNMACAPLVIGGAAEAGVSAAENRSVGRKVDDKVLYADITSRFLKADHADLLGDVNINTRFARVMLTGRVKSEEEAQEAVAIAWKADGVEEVINELIVDPDSSNIWNTANDSLIKRNLEGRLLITKDVWVINYSIDVQNGNAYLIGRVKDEGELNRVLNIARTTRGVKRVVSHLQVNQDTKIPTQAPGKATQAPAPMTNYSTKPSPATYEPVSQESTKPLDPISSAPLNAPAGR